MTFQKDFSCETKRPLSINEISITGIFRFFSKIWKMGVRYNTDRTSNKAKPCPTPTSTLNKGDEKLFQR